MPQPQTILPTAPLIKGPECPQCGHEMRLASIEPHERFHNLDYRNFACDCGKTTSDVVARL
jgi:hypothetical protein